MILGISGKINSGKDTVGEIIQYLSYGADKANISFKDWDGQSVWGDTTNKFHVRDWENKKFADKLKDITCMLLGCTREKLEDREYKETELGEEWYFIKGETDMGGRNSIHAVGSSYHKGMLEEYGDVEIEKLTPRLIIQLLGTEAGREIIHPNIWVSSLMVDYKYNEEEWIAIQGYEDKYQVSSFGRVKSLDRVIEYGDNKGDYHTRKGKILKPTLSGNYQTVSLEGRNFTVHFLVAQNFLKNDYKEGLVVNHKDFNCENNYYKNLEWVTQSQNIQHNYIYGRGNIGENQKDSKLNEEDVLAIKQLLSSKEVTQKYIADKFNVSPTTITDIKKNRKWSHVGKEFPIVVNNVPIPEPNWIITDMRFPNELDAVKSKSGITIRINRPSHAPTGKEHASETSLDGATFDYVITNDGTLEELVEKVREILIKEKLI